MGLSHGRSSRIVGGSVDDIAEVVGVEIRWI
jgi:hypothetical protein